MSFRIMNTREYSINSQVVIFFNFNQACCYNVIMLDSVLIHT